MSPKKEKQQKNLPKNIGKETGIFTDIKIDIKGLDGPYNDKCNVASDNYRPYTIFGNGE